MSKVCDAHKTKPAFIYGECVGCELEDLRAKLKAAEAEILTLKLQAQSNRTWMSRSQIEALYPATPPVDVNIQFDRRGKASSLLAIVCAIHRMRRTTGQAPSVIRVTQAGFNKLKLDARAFEVLAFDGIHNSIAGVRVEIDNSLSSQIDAVCHAG